MTILRLVTARHELAVLALGAALPVPALAGPPFETDDPAPTELHHWELYLFADGGGRGSEFDGTTGADVNYGVAPGFQATVTLPLEVSSEESGALGVGDVDIGAKYRFLNGWTSGWSAAIAPKLTLPVASRSGPARLSGELPIWIGWERGYWNTFAGGGYAYNPGPEGRNGWFGGAAVTHVMTAHLTLGIEATRRDADSVDARAETGFDMGATLKLARPFVLYASAGPVLIDGERTRYRFFFALGGVF